MELSMQFAINWSPEAAELLAEGKIDFDLYKCPDWPELIADAQSQKPAYIHFPIVVGRGQSAKWDFAKIHQLLEQTGTRYINSHITPHEDFFSHAISIDDLVAELRKELEILSSEFGTERITIENCPDYVGAIMSGFLKQGAEAALFHGLAAETGCGLLLDIAHAHIISEHLNLRFEEYINALPVHLIREMHVTGMGYWSNGVYADHMPMTAPDWERFDYCMGQIAAGKWQAPEIVAFEYGGIGKLKDLCGSEKSAIEAQVPRFYSTIHSTNEKAI
jgi:uncharacterized protein